MLAPSCLTSLDRRKINTKHTIESRRNLKTSFALYCISRNARKWAALQSLSKRNEWLVAHTAMRYFHASLSPLPSPAVPVMVWYTMHHFKGINIILTFVVTFTAIIGVSDMDSPHIWLNSYFLPFLLICTSYGRGYHSDTNIISISLNPYWATFFIVPRDLA